LVSASMAATTHRELHTYTFDQYVNEFQKPYTKGGLEYKYRKGLFDNRLNKIMHVNGLGKQFKLGVNKFTDMTEEEFHPMRFRQPHKNLKSSILSDEDEWKLLATNTSVYPKFSQTSDSNSYHHKAFRHGKRHKTKSFDWSSWPVEKDWTSHMTEVHDQAGGSCWAHTAVEALEASSAIAHNSPPVDLSVQEIVSCVQNPKHCGGDGGCSGSIVELAFDYVVQNGLRKNNDYPFDLPGICTDNKCSAKSSLVQMDAATDTLSLTSWKGLTSNKVAPIMDALQKGPVAIALSTDGWRDYEGGILEVYNKNVIIGHAVLLVGYGEENGNKFWKIRNSWGYWGENGYIRLKRQDDPESWCGKDTNAQAGTACQDDPKVVTVCGSNGILYDAVVVTEVGKI